MRLTHELISRARPILASYGSEEYLECFVALLRILAAVLTALLLLALPFPNKELVYLLILGAGAYSVVILYLAGRKHKLLSRGYLPHSLDVLAVSAAVALTGGFSSEFYVTYYPSSMIYAVRFGFNTAILSAVGVTVAYTSTVALTSGIEDLSLLVTALFRTLWALVLALGAAYLGSILRQTSGALDEELQRTRALLRAAHAPTTSLTVVGAGEAVAEQSLRLTDAEASVVYLRATPNDKPLTLKAGDEALAERLRKLLGSGSYARDVIIEGRRPFTRMEIERLDSSPAPWLTGLSSICVAAMRHGETEMGIVGVARSSGYHTQLHYEALVAFLERAELAVENARLYEQLQAQIEELRSLHSQIVHTERLAAIGELAAKVAHELNNPLTSIDLYNSLLLEQPASADEQRRVAASVLEQVGRAKQVVRDILDYSRPRQPRPEVVELNRAVEQGLRLIRHAAQTGSVTIAEDYAGNLPPVHIDVGAMAQVITNLGINAIQAMSQGGTLTVATGAEERGVYIRFSDTGPGIPPEYLQRVFEPFFTTKGDEAGTGLGLSVCRSLVTQHRGRISVENLPGGGACFTVWLPSAQVETVPRRRRRHA